MPKTVQGAGIQSHSLMKKIELSIHGDEGRAKHRTKQLDKSNLEEKIYIQKLK